MEISPKGLDSIANIITNLKDGKMSHMSQDMFERLVFQLGEGWESLIDIKILKHGVLVWWKDESSS